LNGAFAALPQHVHKFQFAASEARQLHRLFSGRKS
jgi:hypothetical protein